MTDRQKRPKPKKADRFKFTKSKLDALPVPTDRVAYHYDTEVPGLRIAIHPTGKRTFSLYRKFRRRATTYPLGEFPHAAIESARKAASRKIGLMADGINPRDDLRLPPERTLGAYFERYLAEHTRNALPLTDAQRHGLRLEFDRYLAPWRGRALSEITRDDVKKLMRQVGTPRVVDERRPRGGPVAANRLLALLSSIFNDARYAGIVAGDAPTRSVEKFRETPRRRKLERGDEFARFLRALADERDRDLRDFLTLRLFTGVRGKEILGARWTDVDVERARWHLGETKNGEPRDVRLSPFVLENVFCARPRTGDWVFPGRRRGDHRKSVTKPWRAFLKRVGLTNFQPRDLRRTFGTQFNSLGFSMDVIAQSLGHKPGSKVTASVYALTDEETQRRGINATVQAMLAEAKA